MTNAQTANTRKRFIGLALLAGCISLAIKSTVARKFSDFRDSNRQSTTSHSYIITALRPPDGLGASSASGININGDVLVTSYSQKADHRLRSYVWRNGAFTRIEYPGVGYMKANGINDKGRIVGMAILNSKEQRPFIWQNGKVQFLPTLGTARRGTLYLNEARSINNFGQVAGSVFAGDHVHLAIWDDHGKLTDVGATLKIGDSMALGTNGKGEAVGYLMSGADDRPIFYSHRGGCDLIRPMGNDKGDAFSINDKSEIVGTSESTDFTSFPYLLHDGVTTRLETPRGMQASASAINNSSQIVGYGLELNSSRALTWMSGKVADLNSLIPKGSGWILSKATAINDRGQIAGDGELFGKPCAFLLTPTAPNRR